MNEDEFVINKVPGYKKTALITIKKLCEMGEEKGRFKWAMRRIHFITEDMLR